MRQVLISAALLVASLALAVLCHALLARACKAVLSSLRPLASDEHEAFGYQRCVYHTAEPAMQKVAATALAAGLLAWLAWLSGYGVFGVAAFLCLLGAVALDLRYWERVTAGASSVWFQRGYFGTVHRVGIEGIRDLAVDEEDIEGLTLRNLIPGRRNTLCRLRVRLEDKRVLALPRTDAARGLADVEAVANHVRLRKQQAADKQALSDSAEAAEAAVREALLSQSSLDKEMAAELARLRRKALAPDVPPAAGQRSRH